MSVLSDWVAELPSIIKNLTKSKENIESQISDLAEKKEALEDTKAFIVDDLLNNILPSKVEGAVVATGPGFGTTNVSLWMVYETLDATAVTESGSSFRVTDGTFVFEPLQVIAFNSPGYTDFTVVNTVTDDNGDQIVTTTSPKVPGSIDRVLLLAYVEGLTGWDDDEIIVKYEADFPFINDHEDQPLGLNGTYGLDDMSTKLSQGRDLLQKNLDKYTSALERYVYYVGKGL